MSSQQVQDGTTQDTNQGTNYNALHISNLDSDITEEDLQNHFSQEGEIRSVRITKDNLGNSRGFGFVTYKSSDDGKRARRQLNFTKIRNNEIKISYNRHPSKLNSRVKS